MTTSKEILIVGSGIAGLRAALEMTQCTHLRITVLEKSPSVGGRIATRRFGDLYVNHGSQRFDGLENVFKLDPKAKTFLTTTQFEGRATDLPKKMRDELLERKIHFKFNWEVSKVQIESSTLLNTTGETLHFDHLIMTAPCPQAEKLTGMRISGITYQKSIIFLGLSNGEIQRIEMDPDWSEKMFDRSDEEILREAGMAGLSVKKWRYARVKDGLQISFLPLTRTITLAGDAFDPNGNFDLSASWLSGMNVGKEIVRRSYE